MPLLAHRRGRDPLAWRLASVKTRALAVIALLITVITGTADHFQRQSDQADRVGLLRFRAELLAQVEAEALTAPLWSFSDDQIRMTLAGLAHDPDFLAAEVTGADGKRLAVEGTIASAPGFIEAKRDIVRIEAGKRERLGQLLVRLSTTGTEAAFDRQRTAGLTAFALMLAAIMIAIYAALHLITTPLARMTEVMTRLAAGDRELDIPGTKRHDEIGAMARAVAVFKKNASEVERLSVERERLEAEAKEQVLRRRFAVALDSSAQAIVLLDAQNRIVACNAPYLALHQPTVAGKPAVDSIVGLSFEQAVRLRIDNGLYRVPQGRRDAFTASAVAHHGEGTGEWNVQLADDRWMNIVVRRTPDGGTVHVWTDVTAIKTAAAQQRALEHQLHHSQKLQALGTLAGGIAHDLNNTLVPVIGLAKLTMRRLPEGSRERANLESILHAGQRAGNLVRQVLAFSRNDAPHRESLDLARLARQSLAMLTASLPATIHIDVAIADVPPVLGDDAQIHQVIMNVVINAAKAIGGKIGRIRVALAPTPDGKARLEIEDSGCGMDEVTLQRIFEPFFTTRPVNEGTGLGLSIVHGIVASHGGTISVASRPGEGSRFTIDFPAADPAPRTGAPDAPTASAEPYPAAAQ
jgi:signal transduction histidine kinase/HAMP domain-containing protein